MRDASSAPIRSANPEPPEDEDEGTPARLQVTGRNLLVICGFFAASLAALYYLLPQLAGLQDTWHRIEDGSPWWMLLALAFTLCMFVGYVMMFRGVFGRAETREPIGWRESYEITMAGLVATRLFAAAGAGGVALTAWALRRSGMESRLVACRMVAFMVLLYAVYAGSLLIDGIGLGIGLLPGGGSFAITVVPAIFGAAVIAAVASAQWVKPGEGRVRAVMAPVGRGVRDARRLLRTGNAGLIGALMWWGFDIAVLWACFEAFGELARVKRLRQPGRQHPIEIGCQPEFVRAVYFD